MNKYSNSPALALTVRASDTRRQLLYLLLASSLLALWLVHRSAYPSLALWLTPPVLLSLRLGWREPLEGMDLRWQHGTWSVSDRDGCRPVEILRDSVCLPWLTCLAWREGNGRRRGLVLFADSADTEQLRRLRCRLLLEG